MNPDKNKQVIILYSNQKICKYYKGTCIVNNDKLDDKIMELKLSDCKIIEVLNCEDYTEIEGYVEY